MEVTEKALMQILDKVGCDWQWHTLAYYGAELITGVITFIV